MERTIQRREIEGDVYFHRSEGSTHVYGRTIRVEKRPSIYPGLQMDSIHDFIDECLATMTDIEGKRIRVSVEVIE